VCGPGHLRGWGLSREPGLATPNTTRRAYSENKQRLRSFRSAKNILVARLSFGHSLRVHLAQGNEISAMLPLALPFVDFVDHILVIF
jgi:hypothetical protein